jgi:hypothetical protein
VLPEKQDRPPATTWLESVQYLALDFLQLLATEATQNTARFVLVLLTLCLINLNFKLNRMETNMREIATLLKEIKDQSKF